jgi:hypothetical protein
MFLLLVLVHAAHDNGKDENTSGFIMVYDGLHR